MRMIGGKAVEWHANRAGLLMEIKVETGDHGKKRACPNQVVYNIGGGI